MRRVIKHIILGLVAATLTTSCVTLQPTASSIGNEDYNQRVEINNPKYKKKHNALGFAFDISMPIAGAAAGAALDPFARQTSSGQKSFAAGGAVLGAIVGTGLTYANHAIQKYGSNASVKNQRTWVDKAFGSNYLILETSGNYLRIINSSAERNYIVKNLSDVKDFAIAFPSSLYSEQVVAQAVKNLRRDDLPEVLSLFPQTTHAQELKDRYINESPSFQQLVSALQKYPKPDAEVEELFSNLVRNPLEAVEFHQRYPHSSYNKKVVINAFQTNPNIDDVRKLEKAYGNTINLNQKDLSKASDKIKRNYYVAMSGMTNSANMSQLDRFNEKYSWLTFKDKKYEIASLAWTLADRLYPKGKDVIAQAGKVVSKAYAKNVGLTGEYFNGFVNEKLKLQFEKLKLVSTNYTSSTSDEFERWKKSAYAAGFVKNTGNLQFLVYGEMKNESKFDFPVVMQVFSNVCQRQKIESGGMLGGVFKFIGALTNAPTEHVEVLGTLASKEYIIPCALSGQTMPYAILIEFEDKVFNGVSGGMNVLDLVKVSSQIELNNPTVKMNISDRNATKEQLAEQNEWLKMAINGLPQAKTIDWFRNQEYKQDTWDAEWARILRESKNRSYSSSRTNEDRNSYEDTESHATKMCTCRVRLIHKDGTPISAGKIHAEWDEGGGMFQNSGKGEFEMGDKGNVVISWPADEGNRVYFISFLESIMPAYTNLENLDLKAGEYYELNVDALK